MPYVVTVKSTLSDVVLPNGMRVQGGGTAFLTDDEYATLSTNAVNGTSVFSAVTAVDTLTTAPTENPGSQGIPMKAGTAWASYDNPNAENGIGQPASGTTTPYDTPNTFLDLG